MNHHHYKNNDDWYERRWPPPCCHVIKTISATNGDNPLPHISARDASRANGKWFFPYNTSTNVYLWLNRLRACPIPTTPPPTPCCQCVAICVAKLRHDVSWQTPPSWRVATTNVAPNDNERDPREPPAAPTTTVEMRHGSISTTTAQGMLILCYMRLYYY